MTEEHAMRRTHVNRQALVGAVLCLGIVNVLITLVTLANL